MIILCPKCGQPLDPGRRKLSVCNSCGSKVPLGLNLFYQSSGSLKHLPGTDDTDEPEVRLKRLRTVAAHNQADPVAALILELTEENAAAEPSRLTGTPKPAPHNDAI